MERKIYCEDCKHIEIRDGDVGGGVGYFCKEKRYWHSNAIEFGFTLKECNSLNKDNNCKTYIRKWWKFRRPVCGL